MNYLWPTSCLLLAGFSLAQQDTPTTFEAQLNNCPAACTSTDPTRWTAYYSTDALRACQKPLLLSLTVHNALADPRTSNKIYACTQTVSNGTLKVRGTDVQNSTVDGLGVCGLAAVHSQTELSIQEGTSTGKGAHTIASETLSGLLDSLESFLQQPQSCTTPVIFAYNLGMAAAVYTGPFTDQTSAINLVRALRAHMRKLAQGTTGLVAQTCGIELETMSMLGAIVSHSSVALEHVQAAVSSWYKNECTEVFGKWSTNTVMLDVFSMPLDDVHRNRNGSSSSLIPSGPSQAMSRPSHSAQASSSAGKASLLAPSKYTGVHLPAALSSDNTLSLPMASTAATCGSRASNSVVSASIKDRSRHRQQPRHLSKAVYHTPLQRRADCSTTIVQSGDGCYAVAQRCGISQDQLQQYNPDSNFCSTLQVGQTVCCSSGTLPSTGPPQNADGTCANQSVQSGDSCGSLATKCGITANNFLKYNPQPNLCSSLQIKQRVCCSPGTLPDIKPKQNGDGSCSTYTVQAGDSCSAIAANYGLSTSDIATFNDKTTWGWTGCNNIQIGTKICLSTGVPPFPASVNGAVCGPLVPDTAPPSGSTNANDWAKLNPCPLNACCDIYGFCGTTPEFCTDTKGPSGNPGTAPPGVAGCISNCGTSIVTASAPASQISVGYYEAWNPERNCLRWGVDDIGTLRQYTHVHWAFVTIDSNDFSVRMNDTYLQFPIFQRATSFKKIIAFGGWGFSTDPSTYQTLRSAMDPANVDKFISNIVSMLQGSGLDGVDFDWEYPGAPDIPGVPPGLATDGPNYLAMLRKLRWAIGSRYSISIAAPASYWYLRAFPIADMAQVLDYIVYMTYDLHGQWDYGNKWSQEACPGGNCLRSHVNLTETGYALAMITKAGVPTNKIAVGIASYGRSFRMTDTSCTGSQCTYTGPDSGAQPGACTNVAGYISNAELQTLVQTTGATVKYDQGSDSQVLLYGGDSWVSYMDNGTIASRLKHYKSLGFAGSSEWAIDLSSFAPGDGANTIPSDKDTDFQRRSSQGYPFGFRDQRPVCTSFQDRLARSNFYRTYQNCYNADVSSILQPQISGTTSCIVNFIHNDDICSAGCTSYMVYMKYQWDPTLCSFYRKRFEKYLDGFVAQSRCSPYWQCSPGNTADYTVITMVLLTPQHAHVNSMFNDMFPTVDRSMCRSGI